MKIKKFKAGSMSQALKMVKNDLGSEAVILSTRDLNRMFSPADNAGVEVTAALGADESTGVLKEAAKPEHRFRNRIKDIGLGASSESHEPNNQFDIFKSENRIQETQEQPVENSHFRELSEVKNVFETGITRPLAEKCLEIMPGELGKLYRHLPFLNIHPDIIDELAMATVSGILPGNGKPEWTERWSEFLIQKCKQPASLTQMIDKLPLAFTGMPGCGRSTLIARIAYQCMRLRKIKPVLITIDGYNIPGQFQLKRVAKILDLNFYAFSDVDEVESILDKYSNQPVLIDLPAIMAADEKGEEGLRRVSYMPVSRVLVVDSSQHFKQQEALMDICNQYKLSHLAVTRLEDTVGYGGVLTALIKLNLTPLIGSLGRKITAGYIKLDPRNICSKLFSQIVEGRGDV
ncbi:MAG: hypothetical protein GF315_12860 [candidate division Zixibacteria bacterium]|nr:hypothetical protein [candidate division Zixibacteria bacterium]